MCIFCMCIGIVPYLFLTHYFTWYTYVADSGLHSCVHTSTSITPSRSQPQVQFWAGEHKVFSDILSDSSVVVVDAVGNVNILETGYEELQRFVVYCLFLFTIPSTLHQPSLHTVNCPCFIYYIPIPNLYITIPNSFICPHSHSRSLKEWQQMVGMGDGQPLKVIKPNHQ